MISTNNERGLSGIEVAIVLFILLVLVAICPSFDSVGRKNYVNLIRRSSESASKSGLESLRAALNSYRAANAGRYPANLDALTIDGKYLKGIPAARTPNYHPLGSRVRYGTTPDDSGGWLYANVESDAKFGKIWVNCTHTDTSGSSWTSY